MLPNRNSRPAILLREGWRAGKKVCKRTIANLTDWPAPKNRRKNNFQFYEGLMV